MLKDELLQLMGHSEDLLQSYRALFITSQSVMFSVSVFLASSKQNTGDIPDIENGIYLIFLAIAGISLIGLWIYSTFHRGYAVWYFQWKLLLSEQNVYDSDAPFNDFSTWQSKSVKEKRAELSSCYTGNKVLSNGFSVRHILNTLLPGLFLLLWVALLLEYYFNLI